MCNRRYTRKEKFWTHSPHQVQIRIREAQIFRAKPCKNLIERFKILTELYPSVILKSNHQWSQQRKRHTIPPWIWTLALSQGSSSQLVRLRNRVSCNHSSKVVQISALKLFQCLDRTRKQLNWSSTNLRGKQRPRQKPERRADPSLARKLPIASLHSQTQVKVKNSANFYQVLLRNLIKESKISRKVIALWIMITKNTSSLAQETSSISWFSRNRIHPLIQVEGLRNSL